MPQAPLFHLKEVHLVREEMVHPARSAVGMDHHRLVETETDRLPTVVMVVLLSDAIGTVLRLMVAIETALLRLAVVVETARLPLVVIETDLRLSVVTETVLHLLAAIEMLVEMTAQWREVLLQPNFDLFIHQLSHFLFFKKQKAEPPKERPKLSLKPRSVPVEEGVAPVAEAPAAPVVSERPPAAAAAPVSSAAIFGGAKPVDTAARERAIEERLKEKQMKEREPIRGRETDRHE